MLQEMVVAFDEAEKTVGAEGLHQALHRAEAERFAEVIADAPAAVVSEQFFALGLAKIDIWIVQQRSEIILRQTGSHSLEIDQVRLAVAHNDVLRLEIAMDQKARQLAEPVRDFIQRGQRAEPRHRFIVDLEIAAEAVFEKITLLPGVKRGVKFSRQALPHLLAD